MKNPIKISLSTILIVLLFGCGLNNNDPIYYQTASALPNFQQNTFNEYVDETQQWLRAERYYIGKDKEYELMVNSPQEYRPEQPNGIGILLVHGLGDSPYSFSDIARHLSQQGYLVRTMLLPGHGSKVGDLKLVTSDIWQASVDHQVTLLRQQAKSVWLGGYSTGANLVTSHALLHSNSNINGLILYSPAFKAQSQLVSMSRYAQYVIPWADRDIENNYLRYESLPMNAAASYYETTKQVRKLLSSQEIYSKPVFMVMSEGDRVIDKAYASSIFTQTFVHPNSRLIWLGDTPPEEKRVYSFSMSLPELKISESSHMGALFSPKNQEYGQNGRNRICSNGQREEHEQACLSGEEVWYASYGYIEEGKIHARLTYNPYFDQTMQLLDQMIMEK
ncbi:esterase [Vibrio alginolyticus]|nr:esterase [Vibrio alginolyticus]